MTRVRAALLGLAAAGSLGVPRPAPLKAAQAPLLAGEILGRPSDRSVTVRALADEALDVYVEWGTQRGVYTGASAPARFPARAPIEVRVEGLRPDTEYFYRLRLRPDGAPAYTAGEERRFHTWRPPGRPFTFVIQADPHLDENSSARVYAQTLANELLDQPDFMLDLGDSSMADKCAISGSNPCARPSPASADAILARNLLARSYHEQVAHSVPLFLVMGNHEGEAGWLDDGTPNNVNVWDTQARKLLYANPVPDGFYAGNESQTPFIGQRENYYAFEWGDALIVALDPFAFTTRKPTRASDEELWRWTLGETQYRWLRRTLETSSARFKLVFSHHLLGGVTPEARGGAAFGRYFEWGGRNLDGGWGFDARRPGWGKPIHQLLVDNNVKAWFHGHDHVYVAEELDGIAYQAVPQPSLGQYGAAGQVAEYGYLGIPGVNAFASSGHLRVSVGPDQLRVEYVQSVPAGDETGSRRNGAVVHSYVVRP